ncbi:N-acetylgalactosamine 6-sulfatase (GALNS) [Lentisphaera araneosa HTCC2155]|jgi:arylsulfatase A-like enzyme|uniref:N-acetylgalactosamine 6-sulfatase (GALNS) n=1 Tax=Lentisphaera araneosa HTCC2155 TaxID=313628 RepID=A6DKN7_9BACT|nr:sulfatase-like hydrolase/transferase [Lentisphaera araneosa]EDM27935.1 N-acetylgalactosamine 6-sulfatase (GALNS) [Lentisphaera araneosa HTCC2155]
MKQFILLLLMSCFAMSAEKTNIILIFADDMHYGALGVTGSVLTKAKTPAIDSIFNEGVHFPNGYASHATCAPSRAGLLTGRYQARFDLETLPGGTADRKKTGYGVKTSEIMIPALMKKGGYQTCAIGKWHLGSSEEFQPNARGFDHWFGYRGSCGFYQFKSQVQSAKKGQELKPLPSGEDPNLDVVRNGESVRLEGYLTDHFSDEAANWIKENKERPFFMYFAPYNVHAPDTVPNKYIPKGGTAHDGVIAALDASVQTILDALKEAGIADNTLVVFSNDNGGKKDYSKTFKGNKATFYEGGIRVPFAMRWPKGIEAGSKYNGVVSTLDLLPTFAALAKVDLPSDRVYDGQNLLPVIKDSAKDQRQAHFWRNGAWRTARVGDWKLVWQVDRKKQKALLNKLGIKHVKGRGVTYAERADELFLEPELYNLANDPKEESNLAQSNPEKLQEMVKIYKDWEASIPKWRE